MSSTATQYAYKVRDASGKFTEGKVEAVSEAAVAEKLMAMGYVPLEVKPANVGMQREINIGPKKRVKTKDLAVFSRQFATMIDAGLTMIRALNIMADQSDNPELRKILRAVKQDVEAGLSLSASFAKFPETFPPLMINMTKAGEAGGFLDGAMRQIADNFEAEVRLRGKIKAALTYPVVVFILAMLMCVAMLIFVVPVFSRDVRGPRRRAAAAHQDPGDAVGGDEVPAADRDRGRRRLHDVVAQVRPDRAGAQRRRPGEAEAAGLRQALPEARAHPLRPQPRHPALLRRPDPPVDRHRLGDHRLDRDLPGAQPGPGVRAPR